MSFFESLQNSAFTESVLGSESVWAYPTILTLHTVGLAILVGASAVLHLRLLGVGAAIPLDRLRLLYSFIWPAFALNLASGVVLFITQAADRVTQPLFYIKLGSIAVALWLGERAKKTMFIRPEPAPEEQVDREPSPEERSRAFSGIAVSALACWTVAIIAGRLMAYYSGN